MEPRAGGRMDAVEGVVHAYIPLPREIGNGIGCVGTQKKKKTIRFHFTFYFISVVDVFIVDIALA
jgi:hypothetical protein